MNQKKNVHVFINLYLKVNKPNIKVKILES